MRKAELMNVIGLTGGQNVQQENVQKLDILSNEIMVNLSSTLLTVWCIFIDQHAQSNW